MKIRSGNRFFRPIWRKLKIFFSFFGYELVRSKKYLYLDQSTVAFEGVARWTRDGVPSDLSLFITNHLKSYQNYSQLQADLVALYLKRDDQLKPGFFVEFGATDGIHFSNTYILEKFYGWEGILAEPGANWHEDLRRNRKCNIDFRCIWEDDDSEIEFSEDKEGEYSTISSFSVSNINRSNRKIEKVYSVRTVTLESLLLSWSSPKDIDYVSIDTEGSEFEILKNFPFHKFDIQMFSIEHNYSDTEFKVEKLMNDNGYDRIFRNITQWDGWYIKRNNPHYLSQVFDTNNVFHGSSK